MSDKYEENWPKIALKQKTRPLQSSMPISRDGGAIEDESPRDDAREDNLPPPRKRFGSGGFPSTPNSEYDDGPAPDDSAPSGKKGILSGWKTRVAALVFAIALAASVFFFIGGDRDHASEAEKSRIQAQWEQVTRIEMPLVAESEQAKAIDSMQMEPQEKQRLQAAVDQGQARLVWLTLWDSVAEDGDVVVIESEGFRQTVPIWHAPTRIAIPEPAGGYATLSGLKDGGGGITVGVLSGSQEIPVPFIEPGHSIGIPVQAGF